MKRLSTLGLAFLLSVVSLTVIAQSRNATKLPALRSPVQLLTGYKLQIGSGTDTWGGTIWKVGGLKIEWDSGLHVGVAADLVDKKDVAWQEEQVVNGQQVICVYTTSNDLIVSFPRLVTNFQGHIERQQDLAEMLLMILTFEPTHGYAVESGAIVSDLAREVKTIEEVCVLNLRSINSAQGVYWGGDAKKGYARALQQLGPKGEGMLEAELASGRKSFYRFKLIPEPADSGKPVTHYVVLARPINRITKEQKSFYTDESGVIRFTTQNRTATIADPPID
jgi:hypothetical protein